MTSERGIHPLNQEPDHGSWDLEQAAAVLGAQAAPTDRFPFGEGQQFVLAHGEALALFPGRRIAQLRSRDFELTLTDVDAAMSTDDDGSYLALRSADTEHGHVLAFRNGVRFAFGPATLPDVGSEALTDPTQTPESAARSETSDEASSPAEQQRVTLTGTVEQTPTHRTSPKGTRIARFRLRIVEDAEAAEHTETVLAFNRVAEQLERNPLEADQLVQIVGYPHEREVTSNGRKTMITEIYATAVRRQLRQ